jgi:PPE-repeat protein
VAAAHVTGREERLREGMPVVSFVVLPPEINSSRIFAGAGSGPMLAAAAAWDGLAGELGSAAESFGSVTSGLIGGSWQGAAAAAMASAAAPYAAWLRAAAAQAEMAASQAKATAAVYEATRAATVHPAAVTLNRSVLVSLVRSNLLGLNAPAIAAVEGHYELMWAQDVAAMSGYHSGVSELAAQLTPWAQSLQSLPSLTGVNLGIGNLGSLNVGNGNLGSLNFGDGNSGPTTGGTGNIGLGNYGSFNLGAGNGIAALRAAGAAGYNVGTGNLGLRNIGIGNAGTGNIGISNGNLVISLAARRLRSTWVSTTSATTTGASAISATSTSASATSATTTSVSGSTATTRWASAG